MIKKTLFIQVRSKYLHILRFNERWLIIKGGFFALAEIPYTCDK